METTRVHTYFHFDAQNKNMRHTFSEIIGRRESMCALQFYAVYRRQ